PAHDDRLLVGLLRKVSDVKWEIFSKHSRKAYSAGNIVVRPVDNLAFNKSLAACEGLLTAGGFESPAEALFLGKKVFAVPMMGQWEQQCNAEALARMGVPVARKIGRDFEERLRDWVRNGRTVGVSFPDRTG